jgi:hypothetical protein
MPKWSLVIGIRLFIGTICPITLRMGDREGRPCIMWRFRHWGAGEIVEALQATPPMRSPQRWVLQPPYPCARVGADLRVCPCATMFALQCNAAYCACRGEWVLRISPQNRANTQVCPYQCTHTLHNMPHHFANGRP